MVFELALEDCKWKSGDPSAASLERNALVKELAGPMNKNLANAPSQDVDPPDFVHESLLVVLERGAAAVPLDMVPAGLSERQRS